MKQVINFYLTGAYMGNIFVTDSCVNIGYMGVSLVQSFNIINKDS